MKQLDSIFWRYTERVLWAFALVLCIRALVFISVEFLRWGN